MSSTRILIADDNPETIEARIGLGLEGSGYPILVRHPRDIVESDLSDCAVVLVDHYLDDWVELERKKPAVSPRDGFALAAVLRSQIQKNSPGPAFAILTGKLDELAGSLPLREAEHLLAWQHDVEWVFPKDGAGLTERIVEIASAVELLRNIWDKDLEIGGLATHWLALGGAPWKDVAIDHVSQTRPPIHKVNAETTGASILRWFLHRVLPYPTFLTDINWVATRLDVTVDWLSRELIREASFFDKLAPSAYAGAFSNFMGRRWWRAGLASIIVDLSQGQPFDRELLRQGIRSLSAEEPEFLDFDRPILAHDPKSMVPSKVIDAGSAVQIAPDGWPVYADNAWADKQDAIDSEDLGEIVLDKTSLSQEATP